jgi:hypothetical protein
MSKFLTATALALFVFATASCSLVDGQEFAWVSSDVWKRWEFPVSSRSSTWSA